MCEELKPCSSCGNKKVSIIEVERPSVKYAIWCTDCNTHSPYFTSRKAWNEQQERAIMTEELKPCPFCNSQLIKIIK